jgi:ABC-2 type transport system ATP-binding protein
MIHSTPVIELRRLHRFFGTTRAVDDISYEVGKGQVFGYIGPNGAGKTTSMRILATLDVPTAGDAFVDGFSAINDPDRVRRRLGFMPDYFGTYPNVSCLEYLDFFARAYGMRGNERRDALRRTMGFTGLDVLAHKAISGLSKGMKQRLCLGRAMVHGPSVLILDEPAAGLDPRARIELREMIRSVAAEGTTVLVSSHILTELAEMCDIVGIIEQGQLLAVGTVDEIQRGENRLNQPGDQAVEHVLVPRVVRLRNLAGAAQVKDWLAAHDNISEVEIDGDLLTFSHLGDQESEADLLKAMIHQGFRIAEFASQAKSLEDVFLQVTQGRVQ